MNTEIIFTTSTNGNNYRKRILRSTVQERERNQRSCIFCLLLLIILLLSALYVGVLLIFRTCTCEMSTNTDNQANLSLEVQTTSSLLSAKTLTVEMSTSTNNKANLSSEVQTTSSILSAKTLTVGSRGKAFVVLFMKYGYDATKNIYVTSENGVQINITTSPRLEASLKSKTDRYMSIPSSKHIIIPQAMELQSFRIEEKAMLIETSSDVFVISHDDGDNSVGSTTHIPLHKLSSNYVVITAEPILNSTSQLAVSAIKDNTTITITFKMKQNLPLRIEGDTFYNGDVFKLYLDCFQTYQIEHSTDLTGTSITSSVPIAVFSGNDCNKLENMGGCDHLIEQLPPIDSVDNTYIVPPNSEDRDTLIRITALDNANITYMIGGITRALLLNKFDYFDTKISSSQTCFIESSQPMLVTAFGLHSKTSSMGDPSMTTVPGFRQYLDYYKIVVPAGYVNNYVSIMIKSSSKDSFRINSAIINIGDIVFQENISTGNETYNVRSIRVLEGELTASTLNGEPFGLMFAGVTKYEAYGFSGNSMLI